MTQHEETPSGLVTHRVDALRRARGWSLAGLAERCAATGAPHLNVNVLTNLLTRRERRRDLTLEEVFAFARVFELPPSTLLFVAVGRPEEEAALQGVFTSPAEQDAFFGSLGKVLSNLHALRLAVRDWPEDEDDLPFGQPQKGNDDG